MGTRYREGQRVTLLVAVTGTVVEAHEHDRVIFVRDAVGVVHRVPLERAQERFSTQHPG